MHYQITFSLRNNQHWASVFSRCSNLLLGNNFHRKKKHKNKSSTINVPNLIVLINSRALGKLFQFIKTLYWFHFGCALQRNNPISPRTTQNGNIIATHWASKIFSGSKKKIKEKNVFFINMSNNSSVLAVVFVAAEAARTKFKPKRSSLANMY